MTHMTPQERATICARCTLARCNEQSPRCLIKIERLETRVNRVGAASILRTTAEERDRSRTVGRAIMELLSFKQMTPETMDEMLAPYRTDKDAQ